MSKLAYAAVFAAASTLLASGASAETVNFVQTTGNLYGGVGSVGVSVSNPVGGGSISADVGGFRLTDTYTGTNFIAWCVDLLDNLSTPGVYTSTTSPFDDWSISSATQSLITGLFNTNYTAALVNNATQSAAFQLALWELVYETSGTYSLSGGSFTTSTAGLVSAANTMLNNITNGPLLGAFNVTYWDSNSSPGGPDRQDLVTVSEVPLPAAVWLFGSGLVGLGVLSRKRRKAAEAAAA